LSNSFKYTPDEGSVKIEVLSSLEGFSRAFCNELRIENEYKAQRLVYLKVIDSGIGISSESI